MLLEHEAIKAPVSAELTPRTRRVRHLLRRETIENLGRWLHRCVGYGQRPSRALLSWLATSAAVIAWSTQNRTVENNVSGWAERVSEVVLSPLRVLRLGSNGETSLLGGSGFEPIASAGGTTVHFLRPLTSRVLPLPTEYANPHECRIGDTTNVK